MDSVGVGLADEGRNLGGKLILVDRGQAQGDDHGFVRLSRKEAALADSYPPPRPLWVGYHLTTRTTPPFGLLGRPAAHVGTARVGG